MKRRLNDAPDWYKDAVIYELRVRSFMDSDGDGVGDLAGLTQKLPYLQDLGVTALWLLPLCPSPGRDDGYDISDYYDVHKDVGTLDDFKRFLEAAHARGLRVITELVLNHTSDQHAWFQRARSSPKGSSERNFYVWSDTAERYPGARIIFKDFEHSNWTFDHVAGQYFWHRFYSHQPDLNYDEPAVHEAALDVCDFWYRLGVDGLRLDAVPYLYERDGTNCENLPETHAFLKKLRAHVDAKFHGRMLLAEANQWPEDAARYFGDGDECHMNFHFPIMPRLFMSIHMEDRFPILDILEQTPQIPESCQWAMFLRNHDELTLEMVTDEERDFMYRAYARDPTMRINLGIRRRLAPLCGNDRRVVELMNALLFALPGTPVVYYGDEIGMGDNVYLGDRNGVRTPMQWSADRNAGFSRANPQKLILPIIIDPEYHYEAINVEAQQDNPSSLLWWTKRALALRARFRAFGRGALEFLTPDNHSVLAFVRRFQDEQVLIVANLSRHPQSVELPLSAHKGLQPVELSGGTRFPKIGDAPYVLTLGGRAFYWFSLEKPKDAHRSEAAESYAPPELAATTWTQLFDAERAQLEEALPAWLEGRAWLAAKGRLPTAARVADVVALSVDGGARLVIVDVDFKDADPARYAITLGFAGGDAGVALHRRSPHAVVAHVRAEDGAHGVLFDVTADPTSCAAFADAMSAEAIRRGRVGEARVDVYSQPTPRTSTEPHAVRNGRDAVVCFGDTSVLKAFRRFDDGESPEREMLRFLSSTGQAQTAPPLHAALTYSAPRRAPVTVALLTGFVANEGDAFSLAKEELGRYFERTSSRARDGTRDPRPPGSFFALASGTPPVNVHEAIGPYLDQPRAVGARVGDLHVALASSSTPEFAPEAYSPLDKRSVYQTMRNQTGTVLRALRAAPRSPAIDAVLAFEHEVHARFRTILDSKVTALRMRCHGDLHLGQLLFTGRDYVVTDFEGDRSLDVASRRRKRSPLRDVASLIVSYHRAAAGVLHDEAHVRPADVEALEPWADAWAAWSGATFARAWLDRVGSSAFLPQDRRELEILLDTFVLERSLWEVGSALERGGEALESLLAVVRWVIARRP